MSVYQEKGGYTPQANELANETSKALDSILEKYQEQGMTIEEIVYVVQGEVQSKCLMTQIKKRIEGRKKDIQNEEVNK